MILVELMVTLSAPRAGAEAATKPHIAIKMNLAMDRVIVLSSDFDCGLPEHEPEFCFVKNILMRGRKSTIENAILSPGPPAPARSVESSDRFTSPLSD